MWIKLRKKLILPIKFKLSKRKKIKRICYKEKKELYEKKEQLEEKLLRAQRLKHTKDIYKLEAQIELLTWIIYE